jgi:hypothetical protein
MIEPQERIPIEVELTQEKADQWLGKFDPMLARLNVIVSEFHLTRTCLQGDDLESFIDRVQQDLLGELQGMVATILNTRSLLVFGVDLEGLGAALDRHERDGSEENIDVDD